MFVTVDEDKKLRRNKYTSRYKDKQTVFWDTTNVNLPKPSDADLQRLTWSHYYSGNVGKGGVFAQLCGWIGTFALWTGAVSDTDYLGNAGILEMQKQYATKFASLDFGSDCGGPGRKREGGRRLQTCRNALSGRTDAREHRPDMQRMASVELPD
mmetsp:Transcript_35202/g.71275  ORF Transcript_35202/g.71275 Transcript_35202/m.71275 type:complete len:154 (+) Transcript_35202:1638-2099(+)